MDDRDHGIILRVRSLSESSLVVHWLAAGMGRVATVAKGARRPKSPLLGKLDLFVSADLSLVRSTRSTLHALREVVVTCRRDALARDLTLLAMASYAVHAIELGTEPDTPIPELHDLMTGFVDHLVGHAPAARALYAFEIKLLACLGLEPDLGDAALPPAARGLLAGLLESDWPKLADLHADPVAARSIGPFLERSLREGLGRIPKGRAEALGKG